MNNILENITIYSLSDPITNEIRYIGKTLNLKRRYNAHINTFTKTHKDCWIKSLKNKNLLPKLDIVDIVIEKDWAFWEKHYISLYKSWGFNLTNLTDGGDAGNGISGKKHYLFGKTRSIETIEKIRLKLKGRIQSQEEINKRIISLKKVVHTKEWNKKVSIGNKGKILSEEQKNRLRTLALGKKQSKETIKKRIKFRNIIIEGTLYNSIRDASFKLNIPYSTLRRKISGKR